MPASTATARRAAPSAGAASAPGGASEEEQLRKIDGKLKQQNLLQECDQVVAGGAELFTDVYVPPENILLREGGFKKQIAGFNVERIGNTARSIALGRLAFETAREHALTRKQFDRPLAEFQGLQWKFAEMQIKLDAGQMLLYRAAVNADNGFPSAQETAIAKAFCNEAGHWISSEALQVMGGTGYSQESLIEYCFRRTRGWMIAGGSLEILKNRIAEGVFDRRFSQRPPRAK